MFDSTLQKLKCTFCDSVFDVDALSSGDSVLGAGNNSDTPPQNVQNTWADGETEGLFTYVCKSCGGEIIGDETTAAMSCPYCGNPVVIMGAFTGKLKPDYVIPFKTTKEQAVHALENHLKGKILLPKVFASQNRISEIKGVYVPFWVFDADTLGEYAYRGTKVRRWQDRYYEYKETSYYDIYREGYMNVRSIPIDCSEKFDDTLMESIEPFDFSSAVDFKTAYLAGYFADKFNVEWKTSWERAGRRIANTADVRFRNTVSGYSTVKQSNGDLYVLSKEAKYALFPVWLMSTTWNGNVYTFAMNGQTGKFVGDLPLDKGKYALWLLGLGFGIALLLFLLSLLIF